MSSKMYCLPSFLASGGQGSWGSELHARQSASRLQMHPPAQQVVKCYEEAVLLLTVGLVMLYRHKAEGARSPV
eukprot:4239815-Pyramimonas_sp.AAC.1